MSNIAPMHQQEDLGNASGELDENCYSKCLTCCGCMEGFCGAWIPCCCVCPNPYKEVDQGFEGLIERFGQYYKTVKPGLHYVNPVSEKLTKIDMKLNNVDLNNQICITSDNIALQLYATCIFKVINSNTVHYRVANIHDAIQYLAFSALRTIIGQNPFQTILIDRVRIAQEIQQYIDEYIDEWGVTVTEVFILDILLTKELADALSSAARERRKAESKLISAKSDVQAAKLMKESADLLNTKAAMQIRYLEQINSIANNDNTQKIVFVPFDETTFAENN